MYPGIQSSIRANRMRTIYLLLMFPVFLFGLTFLVFALMMFNEIGERNQAFQLAGQQTLASFILLGPIIIIWGLISFFFYRQLIFAFSGARPIERKENPKIYNIVENLCISRGLPVPKIGILDDGSMNAFATGWDIQNARIVFSQGLIDRLEDREIEAVAAHELTHIMNKDSLMMIVIVVFIGIIGTLGEIIFRMTVYTKSSDSDKDSGQIKAIGIILGIVFMILGYAVFPLVQLAVSRRREYLADAGSVELTKDKNALISALQKISTDATIESIKKQTVAAMCIETPFDAQEGGFFKNLFSTHPSISDRVKALQSY